MAFLLCCLAMVYNSARQLIEVTSTLTPSVFAVDSLTQPTTLRHKQAPTEIPIVIISSLRAGYLDQVLQSIQPSRQNKNTPSWMLNTTCHVFANRNNNTDKGTNWIDTKHITQKYGCQIHIFEGLGAENHTKLPTSPRWAYHAKHTWYKMMRYLFHTMNEKEVLILEDDAVLAPDALLVAAKLFEHKKKRMDVHGIALGGFAGANKANANPNEFMAVHPHFFRQLAFSMDVELFDQIDQKFSMQQSILQSKDTTQEQMEEENRVEIADLTMEFGHRNFVPKVTQLIPSVGRLHHIGLMGMGENGNGQGRKMVPIPWEHWEDTINNQSRTMDSMYLYPRQVTDEYGFLCDVYSLLPGMHCPMMPKNVNFYGEARVEYRSLEERLSLSPSPKEGAMDAVCQHFRTALDRLDCRTAHSQAFGTG